ncbi:uncharacterized protein LACBIDRAFT_332262 [Laccaria bicolor S238N-H82]|uniref:Predicted protein n=1 Tax=Laccaria bicolor (strain S238N-H82 / ATCC MYA-4686) TaxID=486041 RepID=B0DS49_LACBS|nr:uncharacterized protein LACBIDRAFT_332262 [Laccaria bicolor S238N-H82]EDR02729.1 predicted protein [Laccaria bicolor S238N-H82]|eukprot:XP_001886773.1 predicted protein [Laccaria bicolor S238N-H82]
MGQLLAAPVIDGGIFLRLTRQNGLWDKMAEDRATYMFLPTAAAKREHFRASYIVDPNFYALKHEHFRYSYIVDPDLYALKHCVDLKRWTIEQKRLIRSRITFR